MNASAPLPANGRALWEKLARLRFPWRASLKLLLFGLVTLAVLYPHPVLLVKQIQHLADVESLIQPDLPAMAEINRDIDTLLATNTVQFAIIRAMLETGKFKTDKAAMVHVRA